LVYTGHQTSAGNYELFFETWTIESLAAGASATLELNLFTVVEGVEINNFVQVMTSDQDDPDSTPGNDNDQNPDEDDEAAISIRPFEGGGTGGQPGEIDLELTIDVDGENYNQYENVVYTLTLTNNGPDEATDIFVSAGLPEGLVYTSHNTSDGEYNLFFEQWNVPSLASGASATLELELFTLIDQGIITNFVQVFSADQNDSDSTPGNDTDQTPNEDDEAAVSISPVSSAVAFRTDNGSSKVSSTELTIEQLYPVPAIDEITLDLRSADSKVSMAYIIDVSGKVHYTRQINLTKGANQEVFDISNLADGLYLLNIVDGNGQQLTRSFTKAGY